MACPAGRHTPQWRGTHIPPPGTNGRTGPAPSYRCSSLPGHSTRTGSAPPYRWSSLPGHFTRTGPAPSYRCSSLPGHFKPHEHPSRGARGHAEDMLFSHTTVRHLYPTSRQQGRAPLGSVGDASDTGGLGEAQHPVIADSLRQRQLSGLAGIDTQPERIFDEVGNAVPIGITEQLVEINVEIFKQAARDSRD